ncbi:hypothetical protein EVAR_99352_1 [Eumeta japonica]|uniref:Uncharacterized protein n=1 Tax=Eumeta variegata TaxID=151549 RepID=A0A4C1SP88_EUMVA|nr:hypothetical protein EVAR_99352_1 [Eumeta japonica]
MLGGGRRSKVRRFRLETLYGRQTGIRRPAVRRRLPGTVNSRSVPVIRGILMDNFVMDCPRRRSCPRRCPPSRGRRRADDGVVEPRQPRMSTYTLAEAKEALRRPARDRLLPTRILPSLSEDEEP